MAVFSYRTRNNTDPSDKLRVYFTCHKDDFAEFFDKVCADIFKTHNPAIYYTDDMSAPIDSKENELGRMNLFVVPVTKKLLTEPNRSMDEDIAFAKSKMIPILPLLFETGLDKIYSRPEKFGERQYIYPYSTDVTEISYKEKLKKFLDSVLVSDEEMERVRQEFDAYIFLSYRKKDRGYANELIKQIHKNPDYRSIAIWYDEFLTPGESFNVNIRKMLDNSSLFLMVVTPNILEEPHGKPNFVMGEEYPAAIGAEKNILPVEMCHTDKEMLKMKFAGIPSCVSHLDEEMLEESISRFLTVRKVSEGTDPERDYMIGLAYLKGIDVEIDKEYGNALILSAANAGLPAAMKRLVGIYKNGEGGVINYSAATSWADRYAYHCLVTYGEEDEKTLDAVLELVVCCRNESKSSTTFEIGRRAYGMFLKKYGEEHPRTLIALGLWASVVCKEKAAEAAEIGEKAYALFSRLYGEENPDTLLVLMNLAVSYSNIGEHAKAITLGEKACSLICRTSDGNDDIILTALRSLADIYMNVGDLKKAAETKERVYEVSCRINGEWHFYTTLEIMDLAPIYEKLGNTRRAAEVHYLSTRGFFGEEDSSAIDALADLAGVYYDQWEFEKSAEAGERVYTLRLKLCGEEDPKTAEALEFLLRLYNAMCDYANADRIKKLIDGK